LLYAENNQQLEVNAICRNIYNEQILKT